MHRLLLIFTLSLVCPAVTAGGGDLVFMGGMKNDPLSHQLSSISISLEPFEVLPVQIFITKHRPLREELVSGCVVLVVDQIPHSLVCGKSASAPQFRRVTYKFSGKQYMDLRARFTCIQGCNPRIPREFKVVEVGTGED